MRMGRKLPEKVPGETTCPVCDKWLVMLWNAPAPQPGVADQYCWDNNHRAELDLPWWATKEFPPVVNDGSGRTSDA